MTIEELKAQLKLAMKARDEVKLRTIRSIISAFQKREIEFRTNGKEMPQDELIAVITKQAKMRRESIEMYDNGGREELAAKEREELEVLTSYLPEAMSEEAVLKIVQGIITSTGAESMKDMGRVMGAAMGQLKGKADGSVVQNAVKSILQKLQA